MLPETCTDVVIKCLTWQRVVWVYCWVPQQCLNIPLCSVHCFKCSNLVLPLKGKYAFVAIDWPSKYLSPFKVFYKYQSCVWPDKVVASDIAISLHELMLKEEISDHLFYARIPSIQIDLSFSMVSADRGLSIVIFIAKYAASRVLV